MKKRMVWSYDTYNWDKEEAKENFFEVKGYEPEDEYELDEFINDMNSEYLYDEQMNIESYEKWHGQKYYIILADIGLWNGRFDGGKVVKGLWNAISACFEDYNEIYQEEQLLKVKAIHHDGTNYFKIREITPRGLEYYYNNNGIKEDRHIHDRLFHESHYSNHVKLFNELYGW
jgi:hypothetical protein